MSTRAFRLGDILSITTGRLVTPRGMDGIYDLLNFMTGDDLFTHQLPRACDECRPEILRQHPDLADAPVPEQFADATHVHRWLAEQVARFGQDRDLAQLPPGIHQQIDPVVELEAMTSKPIIAVVVGDGDTA